MIRSYRNALSYLTMFASIYSQAGSFALQGNVGGLTYYSSAVPFKDLMMQSAHGGFLKTSDNTACPVQPVNDANGYSKNLPKDCYQKYLTVFISNKTWTMAPALNIESYKSGHYVFSYTGTADFDFGLDATNQVKTGPGTIEFDVVNPRAGISIVVSNFGVAYPRNFHLVHQTDLATYKTQPFNQKFLNLFAPYSILRFMDWGRTNEGDHVYKNPSVPSTNLTATSLKLGSDASSVSNFYNNMILGLKVNGGYFRVVIKSYNAATKTLTFTNPAPVSTDGLPIQVSILDFYNRVWSQRTPLSEILQTSGSGVAYEYMIQMANITKKNPWFNIPTAANDDFVLNLLKLINTKLDPSLKAYIEYSNETWNYGFPQYSYSEAMTRKLGIANNANMVIPADAYQAYRATQIFNIASKLMGEPLLRADRTSSRFVRVLSSQTAWPDRAVPVMDWGTHRPASLGPTFGRAAHEYADIFAIAPYFGKSKTDPTDITTATPAQLFNMAKNAINDHYGTAANPGIVRQQLANTHARHIKLGQYEGGVGLAHPKDDSLDLLTKLVAFNRSNSMYTLYKYNLAKWKELQTEFGAAAIGDFSQFTAIGSYSKYGYWGAVESSNQPLLSSPKYRALLEFSKNP